MKNENNLKIKYNFSSKWTKDKIYIRLKELNSKGVVMAQTHIRKADLCVWNAIIKHFKGSFKDAIQGAELKYVCAKNGYRVDGRKVSEPKEIYIPLKNKDYACFLGILLGDGWIGKHRIGIEACDYEMIKQFDDLGEKLFNIKSSKYERIKNSKSNKSYQVIFFSNKMVEHLKNELNGNKIPNWILNGDNEIKSQFINGFADAEGYIGKKSIVISQKDDKILEDIKNILESFSINSHIYFMKTAGTHNLCIFSINDRLKYYKNFKFNIKRKQNKLEEFYANRNS